MPQLSSIERRELRARAHNLDPVVSIAENGLTESVLKEIDINLKAHQLIKIRVYGDSRENRIAYLEQICAELDAAPVQHIGKLLIVWRPTAGESATVNGAQNPKSRGPASAPRRTKRSFQG
ncbi:RNA-binding protein [Dechloromonas denitrificans]|uniref:RNA-binding protein n=1 Tax=Dechloromonas denitrificans TaxID=281362 RepID=A0A133XJ14_9RHOO|nr:YhbY family RNA-binding protein [Dechloromonas denitrificans]KXB30928.1 RNA-binding protein [Dechloromonas denitrificans]